MYRLIAGSKLEAAREVAGKYDTITMLTNRGDFTNGVQESLTPEVIQQHYIDALTSIGQSGNLVVVPEGSQPIVGTN